MMDRCKPRYKEVVMACQSVRWFVATVVGLVIGAVDPVTQAGDDKPARRDRLEAIKAEFDKQLTAYRKAESEAKTDDDRQAAAKRRPSLQEFGKRFLTLAEEQPTDEVACDALLWIASNSARREKLELDGALDLVEKHHLKSPKLKGVVDALACSVNRRANALAETIANKAGDREVRGRACFFVGLGIYGRTGARDAKSLAEVEIWMNRVQKDYADLRFEKRTLGDLAEAQVFELRNLIPGKVAPELEGVSVTGQKLKLSDYRGKVVVLVFWGSWCGPCMADVPDWRELTTKYAGRPFTVVGVNSGDTKDGVKTAMKEQKMTWPILFDGEDGPIMRKWNVLSFPMVYVIDTAGVIRYKHGVEDYDKAIADLIWEAERKR